MANIIYRQHINRRIGMSALTRNAAAITMASKAWRVNNEKARLA